ncbi:phospholipase D-like domain-containing protein [Mucilaginibacter polytrichastri]|uniref:phospholipase D n=1 Tax=Mucilaginibacter polytrichastri TaxID=1302689 RepID=A0A1Q5ZYA6_9SPHI|nr:phospholipase D-like domain-containing protein [Mucilaginibacter polytrichastri]OKS86722.1 hypothetical protein RG47T_2179 [Mucilaginibacter polytrichastri]SFS82710.1 Phosphatidylserine/phosphatidylglycerophosphate/cardiolipin synthase [Mucilaginibacter polytrichastri]
MTDPNAFEVSGTNSDALFTLKLFRGERMALLGMNWKKDQPDPDFAGFAIEYQEPGGVKFYPVNNRLSFLQNDGSVNPNTLSSRLSPIQKFRWIHFPYHPDLNGLYTYRVTPVFMDATGHLSYGDFQQAQIALAGETYPGKLNIAFTRGFISSQAFCDRFQAGDQAHPLLPATGTNGLNFVSQNAQETEALAWMGFEAREIIMKLLDDAYNDPQPEVRVTAYDLDLPDLVAALVKLARKIKDKLQIIIDDSGDHGDADSPETQAAKELADAGAKVQTQHVGNLQHNKTIAVLGRNVNSAIGGSTNYSWRGFFVQNNNAVAVHGAAQVQHFFDDFNNLWANKNDKSGFAETPSAEWVDLNFNGPKAKLTFSPHGLNKAKVSNKCLDQIAKDINGTQSSLLFSLAFLYQTKGVIKDAIIAVTNKPDHFVYGISDKKVGGLDIKAPDGNEPVAFPTALSEAPEPFKSEAAGGGGIHMHHKFVVIDFDQPSARVYTGSYNFSVAADEDNGENLWCFDDRKIAVAYMIQAVAMFDHYEWRDVHAKAKDVGNKLYLKTPPAAGQAAWYDEDFKDPQKIKDRELFS